ncbi:Calmodulin regulator protein PCP4 [Dissostichus eleginoides]|uniref:Calmodulin regulator protein PCP4 n=1 Tax=Dissostichus eleginoides TaxID=100907 RepID=A0AAD9CEN4_DISEL|nr:Calmodulin regulator protein PCP4 [Dissostichus eleginoides]
MLVTMLTAMYLVVKVVESIGVRFARQEDPLPYILSQPLPWQVHSVSHSRRSSKADEFDGYRRNSIGVFRKSSKASNGTAAPPLSPVEVEKAAATIQTHYRKFQQKKQKNGK